MKFPLLKNEGSPPFIKECQYKLDMAVQFKNNMSAWTGEPTIISHNFLCYMTNSLLNQPQILVHHICVVVKYKTHAATHIRAGPDG